jgi:peptidoglycan-associated lipoprotein
MSRDTRHRYVVFALTALFVSSVAVGADGAESRLRAELSRPNSEATRPAEGTQNSVQDFALVPQLRPVHFDTDRARLRPGDVAILRSDVQWIKANPNHLVRITAYADERGSRQHNLALAERRANAVKNELVAQGVPEERISLQAVGETGKCEGLAPSCLAANRRADLLVARAGDQQRP